MSPTHAKLLPAVQPGNAIWQITFDFPVTLIKQITHPNTPHIPDGPKLSHTGCFVVSCPHRTALSTKSYQPSQAENYAASPLSQFPQRFPPPRRSPAWQPSLMGKWAPQTLSAKDTKSLRSDVSGILRHSMAAQPGATPPKHVLHQCPVNDQQSAAQLPEAGGPTDKHKCSVGTQTVHTTANKQITGGSGILLLHPPPPSNPRQHRWSFNMHPTPHHVQTQLCSKPMPKLPS